MAFTEYTPQYAYRVPGSQCWTTRDELNWIKYLSKRPNGKQLLENALKHVDQRNWQGPGMDVKPEVIKSELKQLLGIAQCQ